MFLKAFEGWHIVIIAGLLVVLFGSRKLPDSARSIGQSLRIFKSEMKAAAQDGDPQDGAAQQPHQPTNPQPVLGQGTATSSASNGAGEASATGMAHIVGQDTAEFDSVRH
jgi:sec-independent protein translocase protein TatA